MTAQDLEGKEFIALIKRIRNIEEGWCLQDDLQFRAQELSALILSDAVASTRVPLEIWTVFIGLQPYEDSLNTLADLHEVMPQSLLRIIELDSPTPLLHCARDIIIERLNIMTRRELHKRILDPVRLDRIDSLLKKMHR